MRLSLLPALDHPDLLGAPVAGALKEWPPATLAQVAEIDPAYADTAAMCEAYEFPMSGSVNCVLVAGKRDGHERIAACLVRADTRADVNGVVKRTLDVRKASFLPMDRAVAESSMEYGGISPIGLPEGWRLLIDSRAVDVELACIGSGVRHSKLFLPGRALAELPRAEVLGLAT
ncbi:YbaK/EbsC family protein [Nocardioides alcanivorans]|uniref:YbaK/EbsC family protein n=1 Tax=Nocardioides alcanivorans TaxID=2897352 RepID=UPI001F3BB0D9|nr:YbaK/EbsC family protein [Nocardioides alcanivorans]